MSSVELKNVSKKYDEKKAISDITLSFEEGERVVILGASGSGKTTILRVIAGLIAPDSGEVIIGGELASSEGRIIVPPEKRGVGMVFQDLALWPHLTVRGNIEFGLKVRGMKKEERKSLVEKISAELEIENLLDDRPFQLSGGEQQRVALARALVADPEILLMDEPLSHLDYELTVKILDLISALHKKMGFTLIYVTHDLAEAYRIASRIVVMKKGKIVQDGTPEKVKDYFDSIGIRIE